MNKARRTRKVQEWDIPQMIYLYTQGMTFKQVGEVFGITGPAVRYQIGAFIDARPRHNSKSETCKFGHKMTEENTYNYTRVSNGKTYQMRQCRTCNRKRDAQRREQAK